MLTRTSCLNASYIGAVKRGTKMINKQQATSNKQQATSNKQQATSNKQQATSNKQPISLFLNF